MITSSSSFMLNPHSDSITNMSGSEMGNREPFTMGMHQHNPFAADTTTSLFQPLSVSPPYNPSTTVSAAAPVNINGAGAAAGGESPAAQPQEQGHVVGISERIKKKRGRPRKYGPDGSVALGLAPTSPPPPSVAVNQNQPCGTFSPNTHTPAAGSAFAPVSPNAVKKSRGRPRGSVNKFHKSKPLGSAGDSLEPFLITVNTGEDLSARIMQLCQKGSKNICILTANGTISTVTIRQPSTSGGTVTYEGRFEILSLGGSFLLCENDGQRSRSGGLNVFLSGPDGRVLGGGVAGLCIAASPVQVVLATFASEGHHRESKSGNQFGNVSSSPPKVSTAGQSSSPSRGTLSESSGGPGSPLYPSTGACDNNNTPQGIGMPWK